MFNQQFGPFAMSMPWSSMSRAASRMQPSPMKNIKPNLAKADTNTAVAAAQQAQSLSAQNNAPGLNGTPLNQQAMAQNSTPALPQQPPTAQGIKVSCEALAKPLPAQRPAGSVAAKTAYDAYLATLNPEQTPDSGAFLTPKEAASAILAHGKHGTAASGDAGTRFKASGSGNLTSKQANGPMAPPPAVPPQNMPPAQDAGGMGISNPQAALAQSGAMIGGPPGALPPGGAPPMDPSMMGGAAAGAAAPPVDPSMLGADPTAAAAAGGQMPPQQGAPQVQPQPIDPTVASSMDALMADKAEASPMGEDMKYQKMVTAFAKVGSFGVRQPLNDDKPSGPKKAPSLHGQFPISKFLAARSGGAAPVKPPTVTPAALPKTGFEDLPLPRRTKLGWQNNSRPQQSATGEGSSTGFVTKDDDYDKGPAAWANSAKYLKHGQRDALPHPVIGRKKKGSMHKRAIVGLLAKAILANEAAKQLLPNDDERKEKRANSRVLQALARFLAKPGAREGVGAGLGVGASALENRYVFGDAVPDELKKTNLILGGITGGMVGSRSPKARMMGGAGWPMKEVGLLGGGALMNQAKSQIDLANSQKELTSTNLEAARKALEAAQLQGNAAKSQGEAATQLGSSMRDSANAVRDSATGSTRFHDEGAKLMEGARKAAPWVLGGAAVGIPAFMLLRDYFKSRRKPGGTGGTKPRGQSTRITLKQPGDYNIRVDDAEQNELSNSTNQPVRGKVKLGAAVDVAEKVFQRPLRRSRNNAMAPQQQPQAQQQPQQVPGLPQVPQQPKLGGDWIAQLAKDAAVRRAPRASIRRKVKPLPSVDPGDVEVFEDELTRRGIDVDD